MIKILKYGEVENKDIFARINPEDNVADIVTEIIENVKQNGDSALFAYCEKFDKAKLSALEVTEEEIENAVKAVTYFVKQASIKIHQVRPNCIVSVALMP